MRRKKVKILVVDESEISAAPIKEIIENAGYRDIIMAFDKEQAIKTFLDDKPDIITMNFSAVRLNGLEIAKEIINEDRTANIIAFSDTRNYMTVNRAMDVGCKGYVVKTDKEEKIIRSINNVASLFVYNRG